MFLNASKTKVMVFGCDKQVECDIILNNNSVEQVFEYKYLGMLLDPLLSFSLQTDYVVSKAKRAINKVPMLIRDRNGILVHVGIQLYKSLVRPHLERAAPVWASIFFFSYACHLP